MIFLPFIGEQAWGLGRKGGIALELFVHPVSGAS
jgi:hypothetical protein